MSESPILFSADAIHERVQAIAADLDDAAAGPIHLIGILKGALMLLADLARAMRTPVTLDCLTVSTYDGGRTHARPPRILQDLQTPIAGRDVVLVEDIVDTGLTLQFLQTHLRPERPSRLRTVALLDKPARRRVDVAADYVGFTIPDRFVVGYGLDYQERYRHLPYIAEMTAMHDEPR